MKNNQITQEKGCAVVFSNVLQWVVNSPWAEDDEDEQEDCIEEEIIIVNKSGHIKKNYPAFRKHEQSGDGLEHNNPQKRDHTTPRNRPDPTSVAETHRKPTIVNDRHPEVAPEHHSTAVTPRIRRHHFPPTTAGEVNWGSVQATRTKIHTRINYKDAAPVQYGHFPENTANKHPEDNSRSTDSEEFEFLKLMSTTSTGRPPHMPKLNLPRATQGCNSDNGSTQGYSPISTSRPYRAVKAGTPCAEQIERRKFLQMSRAASVSLYNNPYTEDLKEEREHALWLEEQKRREAEEARGRGWGLGNITPRRQTKKSIAGSEESSLVKNDEAHGQQVSFAATSFRRDASKLSDADYEQAKNILANTKSDVAARSDLSDLVFGRDDYTEQFLRLQKERSQEVEKQVSKKMTLRTVGSWHGESKSVNHEHHGGDLLNEDMISVDLTTCISQQEAKDLQKRLRKKPAEIIGWEIVAQRNTKESFGSWVVTGMQKNRYSANEYRISRPGHDDLWVRLSHSSKAKKGFLCYRPIRKVISSEIPAVPSESPNTSTTLEEELQLAFSGLEELAADSHDH